MTGPSPDLASRFERDGFVFPIEAISTPEADAIRTDLEAAEADLAEQPDRLALLRSYPDRLLPSFDRLTRHPSLVAAAQALIGPDLMVWSGGLFIKNPDGRSHVSWHQDLTYWGLDDIQEVTAWVALSPATTESGCMRFVPGSHHRRLVPHADTFSENNLLSRGQEIAVDVDEASAVDVVLASGQASLHHGHLFHASGPNRTDRRRIGVAIRYISPTMRQRNGERSLVTLVSGEDRHDHFTVAGPPEGRLSEVDFERCRRDTEIKRQVLYEGAEHRTGQRY